MQRLQALSCFILKERTGNFANIF